MNISTDDGRMESSDGASFAAPLLSTVAAEAPLFVDVRGQPPSPESVEMMRNDADAVMDGSAVPAMSASVAAIGGWSVPDHNALLHRASEDRELADLLLAADAVTMDLNQPMTGLPPLSAPELKIMGRCVSFCAETSDTHNAKDQANDELIYYEGLVASLNLNTVVLMHVHRMTEMAYQLRQMESSGEVEHHTNHLVCGDGTSTTPASSNAPKVGTTSDAIHDEVASPQHIASAAEDLTALRSPPLTHTHEAAEGGDDGGGREASSVTMMEEAVFDAILAAPAKERNRLGSIHECGGPIPFMTFARSRIHDVIFARDPPSSFFSLFDDPSRHNFDLQCLRMYVRRYLVHCSQGNNPRQVSLRHFIENRCACAGRVEDELLMRIARQELRYLVKVARDMKKATDNRRAPRSVEELLLQYQAPPGLFQRTGILFLTNVPRQTFSVALIELSLVCAWLLYMGITYIAAEALFMLPYLEVLRNHTMTTAVMSTTTVCFTIYHSTVMRIPVDRFMAKLAMIRGMLLLITMLTCILFVVSATSSVMPSSVKDFLLHRGSTSGGRHNICAYYMRHSCSGFDTSCSYLTNEDERAALCSCASPIQQSFMSTCDAPMMITVQQTFVPMLCIGGILMMVLSLDLMLLGRFVLIARIVSMRLNAVRGSGETMV